MMRQKTDHPTNNKSVKIKGAALFLILAFSLALVAVGQFSRTNPASANALPTNDRQSSQYAAPAQPEAPASTPPIQCSSNPFGNVHELFQEQEIFISLSTTDAALSPNFPVLSYILDRRPDGALTEAGGYLEQTDSTGFNVQAHAAAAVDLDGDGDSDFVQSFTNGDGKWYVALYDNPNPIPLTGNAPTYHWVSDRNYSHLTAAAGDIFGDRDAQNQVVIAGVDPVTGKVNVLLWDGTTVAANGNIIIAGRWSSAVGGRQNAKFLDVVVGNFDGDEKDDIAVAIVHNNDTMELVLLEYDPTHNISDVPSIEVEYKLKPLTTKEFSPGTPTTMYVFAGRLNADFIDEIIVVYDNLYADANDRKVIVNAFSYDTVSASPGLVPLSAFNKITTYAYAGTPSNGTVPFAAAVGDIDGAFAQQEVVVGYAADDGLHFDVLATQGLTTTNPSLQALYQWHQPWSASVRTQAAYLSMAVGDMNNDGPGELLAAYDDGWGFDSMILTQTDLSTNAPGYSTNHDPRHLNTPTDIALGDMDDDAIKAVYGGDCREIVENRIVSTLFKPPSWQNIQHPLDLYGGAFVGRSKESGSETSKQLTYERSSVISGYVGAALSVSKGIAEFETSVKATMSQEYMNSSTRGNSTSTSVENSVNYVGPWDFVQTGATTYYCYNYTVMQNGVPIGDNSSVRSCEVINNFSQPMAMDTWDASAAFLHSSQTEALEWTPVSRDWASLALFRESFASQKGGAGSGAASKAVDGNLSGALADMSSTIVQDYPWWEMDLGQVEEISKIRLWSRENPDSNCTGSCPIPLSDVHIFVSETPFNPADTPATLLADANILHYSLDNISSPLSTTVSVTNTLGRVTTFVTLKDEPTAPPQQGRYVRVQIDRTSAQLQLAEVQIFGTNHVEPNRYPNEFRPGSKSGYFEVSVYNPFTSTYEWVETRGELLWTGSDNSGNPVFADQLIGVGDSETHWDRSVYTTTTSFTSGAVGEKTSVGVEFELSGGAIVLAQTGVGYEFSTGVTSETTHSTTWGESFDFGGWAKGFPLAYNNQPWAVNCAYSSMPYYYVITEESSFGFETSYTVLDYVVPSNSLNRSGDLSQCLQGHASSSTPTASNDSTTANGSQTSAIQVLANDAGPSNLHIMSVTTPAHGTASFSGGLIFYKPDTGFVGEDSFDYTIGDGSSTSTGTVTVQVKAVNYLPMVMNP